MDNGKIQELIDEMKKVKTYGLLIDILDRNFSKNDPMYNLLLTMSRRSISLWQNPEI